MQFLVRSAPFVLATGRTLAGRSALQPWRIGRAVTVCRAAVATTGQCGFFASLRFGAARHFARAVRASDLRVLAGRVVQARHCTSAVADTPDMRFCASSLPGAMHLAGHARRAIEHRFFAFLLERALDDAHIGPTEVALAGTIGPRRRPGRAACGRTTSPGAGISRRVASGPGVCSSPCRSACAGRATPRTRGTSARTRGSAATHGAPAIDDADRSS